MSLIISIEVAKVLTIPQVVTEKNIDRLNICVANGSNIYPGANSVFRNGINIPLNDTNNKIKLELGNIVERHIIDGDIMLLTEDILKYGRGNQPTYVVEVDPKTIGMSIQKRIHIPHFNADFDGDEINFYVPKR